MSAIQIADPCNEDWNKMTPTQRGAFCSKCQIDVIDFSHKSPNEIKSILLENRGKSLCGHIHTSQLDALNTAYYRWENQSPKTFQSKFLLACFLAFGLTLFTGCESNSDETRVGEIEWHDDTLLNDTGDYTTTSDSTTCTGNPDLYDDVLVDGLMEIDESYYDSLGL